MWGRAGNILSHVMKPMLLPLGSILLMLPWLFSMFGFWCWKSSAHAFRRKTFFISTEREKHGLERRVPWACFRARLGKEMAQEALDRLNRLNGN